VAPQGNQTENGENKSQPSASGETGLLHSIDDLMKGGVIVGIEKLLSSKNSNSLARQLPNNH